ncbi:hypothetical protein MNEG_14332, partial [Monoraphidium neglectum]
GAAKVVLAACSPAGGCPEGGGAAAVARRLCVLQVPFGDAHRASCRAVQNGARDCGGGLAVAAAAGPGEPAGMAKWAAEIARAVADCGAPPFFSDGGFGGGGGGAPAPVLVAPDLDVAARLVAAAAASQAATLSAVPTPAVSRSGSPQAAAWVAGAAARLMGRFESCGAADVARALIDTAVLLDSSGKPTQKRGRGGLLQVKDAEAALGLKGCAKQAPPKRGAATPLG